MCVFVRLRVCVCSGLRGVLLRLSIPFEVVKVRGNFTV